ncbi:MAG: hypothetical protein RJA44_1384 [Pseudomonadota bacterium]|jgi:predicted porin
MIASIVRNPKLLIGTAALVLAGAAQAQVSVYGLIDLSLGKNEIAGDKKFDFRSSSNSTTKFGFKGSTDVGSGVKANFQLESNAIGIDGSIGTPFFGRQAWAGFSGSFGEVRLGTQDNIAFETNAGFDLNGASNNASALFNAGVSPAAGTGKGKGRAELQYFAPELVKGLKVMAAAQPAGNDAANPVTPTTTKANVGLGAVYTIDKLAVGLSTESKATEGGKNATGLSVSYDLGVAKAMVGYANNGLNADGTDKKGASFGVAAPVAGFNVGVQFAKNNGNDVKGTEFFVNREVLKNTTVYFDYGQVKAPNVDAVKTTALGVIYAF